jgi:hypothetical protein
MVACECELIIGPFVSPVDGLEWHVSEPLAGLDADEMVEQPCLGVKRYCPQMRLNRFVGSTSRGAACTRHCTSSAPLS